MLVVEPIRAQSSSMFPTQNTACESSRNSGPRPPLRNWINPCAGSNYSPSLVGHRSRQCMGAMTKVHFLWPRNRVPGALRHFGQRHNIKTVGAKGNSLAKPPWRGKSRVNCPGPLCLPWLRSGIRLTIWRVFLCWSEKSIDITSVLPSWFCN
jgi:hypothetical protein